MKKEDLILLGIVGVSVYAIVRMVMKKPGTASTPANNYNTTEITRNNGWSYYTDGTAIDPNGVYYYQGAQVYDPRGMYQ
jgi:hypothetical protein